MDDPLADPRAPRDMPAPPALFDRGHKYYTEAVRTVIFCSEPGTHLASELIGVCQGIAWMLYAHAHDGAEPSREETIQIMRAIDADIQAVINTKIEEEGGVEAALTNNPDILRQVIEGLIGHPGPTPSAGSVPPTG